MIKCKYSYDIKRKEKSWFCPVGKGLCGLAGKNGIAVAFATKILVLPYQRGAVVCRPAGLGYEENLEEKGNRV